MLYDSVGQYNYCLLYIVFLPVLEITFIKDPSVFSIMTDDRIEEINHYNKAIN